jgi:NAD(P)-dependent dehydrogenase (short-subunit alcohol dehydrogenase family)
VPDEFKKWLVDSVHLLDRVGSPIDVAALALYLASDESSFVTGADFKVDAGWTAGTV